MSNQKILWGAKLEASTDGGTTWAVISASSGIVVQESEPEYVDVTSLDSPGRTREFIQGMFDPGSTDLEIGYTPDNYAKLLGWKANGTLIKFRSTLPVYEGQSAGDVFECAGYVNPKVVNGTDVTAVLKISMGIKFSGDQTYNKGAAAV